MYKIVFHRKPSSFVDLGLIVVMNPLVLSEEKMFPSKISSGIFASSDTCRFSMSSMLVLI